MRNKGILVLILLTAALCGCGRDKDQDTTPPTVVSTSPAVNATGIAVNSNVKVTFSETMDSSSVNTNTFTVRKSGSNVNGSISYGGTFATFLPMSSLSSFRGYTAMLTTGVKDSNGNPLQANYIWGFITGSSTTSTVSFATHIQPIFNSNCTTACHQAGGTASTFLILTNDVAFTNLVNKSSTQTTGGGLIVKPGDSANSVLYQRISGTGLAGGEQTMPQNRSLLTSVDQTFIKTWIDEGALNN